MSESVQQLFHNALRLSDRDRAELASLLLESLEEEHDEQSETAWSDEIAQRLEELKSGSVTPIPWTEVRRRLMKNEE
jgi:putative addiction module component (TIGR02574 family)